MRLVFKVAWNRFASRLTRFLVRFARATPASIDWTTTAGPYFVNNVGSLRFDGRTVDFVLEKSDLEGALALAKPETDASRDLTNGRRPRTLARSRRDDGPAPPEAEHARGPERGMTRALVIGRKRKGRKIAQHVAETSRALRDAGWTVDDRVVKRKRSLRKRAGKAAGTAMGVVVAVGGDGAVLQVATAIAGSKTALGIIPLGHRQPARREPQGAQEARQGREDDPRQARAPDRRRADRGRRHRALLHGRLRHRLRRRGHGRDDAAAEAALGEARLSRQRGRPARTSCVS